MVTVTNPANGCFATASASATVNPLPTTYPVTGGGTYYAVGNGVPVGLSGSQTGVNYQLLRGGTAQGSPVAGTGSAISFGNQTTAGTYTVLATNASTTCQQTMTGSATVTVLPTPLQVQHLDNDRNLTNNIVQPYLQLQNMGSAPLPYNELTLRYWLTAEQFAPMTNLPVYWAQLGTSKVKMKYVELPQPRQGAFGYVEYSFDASAGSLAPGVNSGPIQNGIGKQDWTPFNEADDYSYANNSTYTANARITAYRNGTLIWGSEPPSVTPVQSVKAYSESRNGPATNTISTYVQVRNEGNLPVSYSKLTVRYYFTSEGSQPLNFYLDYAQLGNSNVKGKLVRLTQPVAGADSYLELSFANLDKLSPLSSTNNIQYRIAKSDWSNFNQNDDHSYRPVGPLAENVKMTIYLDGQLIYGQVPSGAGGRQAAEGVEVRLKSGCWATPWWAIRSKSRCQGPKVSHWACGWSTRGGGW